MNTFKNTVEFKEFLTNYGLDTYYYAEKEGQRYFLKKAKFFKQLFYLIQTLKLFKNKVTCKTDFSVCFKCEYFEKNQKFGNLGNFSIDNNTTSDQMHYEFTYRKSIILGVEIIDIMLNDITEISQIEMEKADNKYRKSYLSNVAHEFKAPIQILLISVSELSKYAFPKEAQLLFKDIENLGNYILILIMDIISFSK